VKDIKENEYLFTEEDQVRLKVNMNLIEDFI